MKKTSLLRPGILWIFALTVIIISSCEKDSPQDICIPVFQAELFEDNLRNELDDRVMGYTYIVAQNGNVVKSGIGGKAQSVEDRDIDMSLHLEMQIASISKFVTTLAAIRVCDELGLPLTTPIGEFLPSSWRRGTGINNVTIAELCNHTAGLNDVGTQRFNATRLDSLRQYVAAGATGPKTRLYSNSHHALLRLILPMMYYGINGNEPSFGEELVAVSYRILVGELIFTPLEMSGNLQLKNQSQILAYSGPSDNSAGLGGTADFSLVSGGTGWHMTTFDIARLWAYAWFSNELINNDDREWVRTSRAGLWNTLFNQKHGTYFCKLGRWDYSGTSTSKEVSSCVMLFPDGTQVTVFINSPIPAGDTSLVPFLARLYDDSFGC